MQQLRNSVSTGMDIPESPFRETLGMTIVDCRHGIAVVAIAPLPRLINYLGQLHGGVIASLIDTAGALAGRIGQDDSVRKAVTLSFTVNFLGAPEGEVRASATVRGGGSRTFSSTVDVFDQRGELIAVGQGVYRIISN